ncbi:helix-turn-helix domain-containing protein [Dyadobacter frigoris]|uniref:Helix-turn-helix transcriptional regulator n=1 Tax=Dyadobacter frigoris TaxID=2576211 RepID=A0A4U6CRK0_9BACT|nr:helix-turn-helix transcriptional regulator [Dyadobacter frigoris]TKT85498.1 helix-turn-helix transcriptional regulator [Dyadobacter frigoris]GLU56225.1 transcriptional regulator [Dyadobacter frigoris]
MDKDTLFSEPSQHIGVKIGSARRLVGITQKDLADRLGVTKQAVSKLEQTEKVDDDRLGKIADALGVSLEGLKKLNSDNVLYYSNNFYENCAPQIQSMNARVETLNHFSIEQAMKLFEELLKMERERFEIVTNKK